MARKWNANSGNCTLVEGTLVDVIHRDGEVFKKQEVGGMGWSSEASWCNWDLDDCAGDIIFWRLSKEKKQ